MYGGKGKNETEGNSHSMTGPAQRAESGKMYVKGSVIQTIKFIERWKCGALKRNYLRYFLPVHYYI